MAGVHGLGRVSHVGVLVTVGHSLWTAPEDESDFSLCVGLVKHVPISNTEKVVEVSIALPVLVHALPHVVRKCVVDLPPSAPEGCGGIRLPADASTSSK